MHVVRNTRLAQFSITCPRVIILKLKSECAPKQRSAVRKTWAKQSRVVFVSSQCVNAKWSIYITYRCGYELVAKNLS